MPDPFLKIIDFANLHRAYKDARKCKRYRSSILKFGYELEENLLALRTELAGKTYQHGSYREFVVTDSKKRTIKAAPFRDRVVHHALCNVIEPILDRGFIYDSYACRTGKGTHAAVIRLESFIKALSGTKQTAPVKIYPARNKPPQGGCSRASGRTVSNGVYCLKCDISKYFESIDHEILFEILQRKIKHENVLWLLNEIIQSNLRGIPIGNLTSQLFANVYLNELDHFVKRILHEKYYIRYMDDFLIVGLDKKRLREDKEKIEIFLRNRLKLELHPKKADIFPIDTGIDFLGYVLRGNRRLLRKSTVKRFVKKMKRFQKQMAQGKLDSEYATRPVQSWLGYARYAHAWRLRRLLESKLGIDFHERI